MYRSLLTLIRNIKKLFCDELKWADMKHVYEKIYPYP